MLRGRRQEYLSVLQNFRGLMHRLQVQELKRREPEHCFDPTAVASFRILGRATLPDSSSLLLSIPQELRAPPFPLHSAAYDTAADLYQAVSATSESMKFPDSKHARTVQQERTGNQAGSSGLAGLVWLAYQVVEQLARMVYEQLEAHQVKRLVIGMSGGADSTLVLVLAAKIRELFGCQVLAVHCIHGLDPDDDIWLEHNRELCSRLQVELSTPVLHIVYGEGVSPEDSSRKERYRALLQVLNQQPELSSALMLGHQADDQIEGFILALKRGSGPQGLAGMKLLIEDQRGILVRPLLDLHKIEIEQILLCLGIPYVYDLSNSYLKFERNFVRLKVLPVLRERFPGVDRAILRSQRLCRMEHELAERLVSQQLSLCLKDRYTLNFSKLDLNDEALITMLLRAFLQQAVGSSAVDFNIIEQARELMAAEHDVNGMIKLPDSPLVLSTFLHYLCLYRPVTKDMEQKFAAGPYQLKLNQPLIIGSYCYELKLAPEPCPELFFLPDSSCGTHPDKGAAPTASVLLDFSYARSQVIRLRGDRCSRSIKKICIARQIAPWQRAALPLVKSLQGEILALGNIAALERPFPEENYSAYILSCTQNCTGDEASSSC